MSYDDMSTLRKRKRGTQMTQMDINFTGMIYKSKPRSYFISQQDLGSVMTQDGFEFNGQNFFGNLN